MKATCYIVYDRRGVLRMTKTLPSLSLGERFKRLSESMGAQA